MKDAVLPRTPGHRQEIRLPRMEVMHEGVLHAAPTPFLLHPVAPTLSHSL